MVSGSASAGSELERGISLVTPAVTYHPLGFSPNDDTTALNQGDIIRDLRVLRNLGFKSLVTYAATGVLGSVPQIARQEGFSGTLIMGIWDIASAEEWKNALSQARYVDGYCLGNEGLGIRYSMEELENRMAELRRITSLPVTTSEPIDSYLHGPYRDWLLAHSDWLFPLAHPFWADQPDPKEAVDWILARHDYLVANSGVSVILKEAGVPTGGVEGYSETSQVNFFKFLEHSRVPFFYFEAFDQPWKRDVLKHPEVEAHWGLYRSDGTPKKIVPWLTSYFANK